MKMKPRGYTGGDPFLNRLKTYIVFCTVPVMCAAKTIQLKALTRPNSHSVLPFGAIFSSFPQPRMPVANEGLQRSLTKHIQMLLVTVTGGVDPRNTIQPQLFLSFSSTSPTTHGLRWVDIDRGLGCSEAG